MIALLPLLGRMGPQVNVDVSPVSQLAGSAVGAFLTTLVVGAILVAVVPDYTDRKMAALLDNPVGSLIYGVVCLVFFALAVFVLFVLFVTVVGIVVALPLVLVLYLVWAAGASIAFLAIGDRVVGHDDGWTKPLLVAAGINGALTLTGIGGIVAFAVGSAGFGAVLRDYLG
jgi:hypothetical protein